MKIVFTRAATDDLDDLTDYLIERSPTGLNNVLTALELCFDRIADGLAKGRETHRPDVREMLETKYGYIIPYFIDGDRAYVLRVYHGRREGLTSEDINTGVRDRDEGSPG